MVLGNAIALLFVKSKIKSQKAKDKGQKSQTE